MPDTSAMPSSGQLAGVDQDLAAKQLLPDRTIVLSCIVATGMTFIVDYSTPLGVAEAVLYVVPVLIGLSSQRNSITLGAATSGTLLTIVGFFLSPGGGELWKVIANRLLAILVIWITTALCLWQKRQKRQSAHLHIENELLAAKRRELAASLELVSSQKTELAAANEALTKSRSAALNMMRDTDAARQKAEQAERSLWQQAEQLKRANADLQQEIAERKRTEEKLTTLSQAIEQSPASVIITDVQGLTEYVSPSFTRLTGFTWQEIAGKIPAVLMSAEMPERTFKQLWETIRSGERWQGELLNKKKDGELYWESASVSPIINDDGEITHFVAVHEDITHRKRLVTDMLAANEGLLAISQLHARLFVCTTLSDVAETLTDALVRYFDAYFARVWLVKPCDLCPECALADSCSAKERCLHLVASAGHYTHIDGDHRRVPIGAFKIGLIAQGRGKTICNDVVNDQRVHDRQWAAEHGLQSFAGFPLVRNGEVIGVMAMFSRNKLSQHLLSTLELLVQLGTSAITSVEKAQALRQSREYANNILRSMINTVIVLGPDGTILKVNEATCKLLGYAEDELIGKPAQMLFDDVQEENRVETSPSGKAARVKGIRLQNLINSGHINDPDGWYTAKDGRKIPVTFSGSVMRDAEGEIQGIVCVAQDSTQQKQLQCKLAQAQKLESVGQLAAGIAHEINTPTQYVGDNTRFLKEAFGDISTVLEVFEKLLHAAKDGPVDERLIEEVEAALKQADVEYLAAEIPQAIDQSLNGVERVATIVRAMKEFSHPGGKEKRLVNLAEAIETTITVARNEWKYVADVVKDFDPGLPAVCCLPDELNQVFLNLIVNAAHAIGDTLRDGAAKKGTITVGTRRDGDHWAAVFVRDTGTGIPQEIRARIFDPFFTTKEVGKGTGQGLAIARSVVVDKHGGAIDCETEQGKGTTFVVRLPIDGGGQTQRATNESEDACVVC